MREDQEAVDCHGTTWKVLPHCAVKAFTTVLWMQDVISPLAIINLFSPGSVRLQGRFAVHPSWWHSLPGSCCTLHSHPSYAQGSCHHPWASQLARRTQMQEVREMWKRHSSSIYLDQLHTAAHMGMQDKQCRPQHWNHVGSTNPNRLPIAHTDSTIWGQCQCLHVWKKCEIALVSSEFFQDRWVYFSSGRSCLIYYSFRWHLYSNNAQKAWPELRLKLCKQSLGVCQLS